MTDPTYAAVEPAPEPPQPDSFIPLWAVLTAIAVMLAGAGVVAYVVLSGALDTKEEQHGPVYPTAWDPRIAPYVTFVEQKRGLAFLHPVAVRFLGEKDFEKTVRSDENELDAEDRKEIDQATGLYRALGLISGDVDLFDASNDVSSSGTLAYYDFTKKQVTIRGTSLTLAARPTLVHELTHVLQDQHFDIGDRKRSAAQRDAKLGTSELEVLDAVIEGDAERIGSLYTASLSARERKAIARSNQSKATAAYEEAPEILVTMFAAPYTLGEGLIGVIARRGGNQAIDDLLRDTPVHDAALLDPFLVHAGEVTAAKVEAPTLDKGDEKIHSGEFGAIFWYLMLASRVPLVDALTAADGWNGDASLAYDHDGTTCTRIAYVGRTGADTARMLQALRRWVAAAPGSPASVIRQGDRLLFQSCDPGKKVKVGKEVSVDAVRLAATRTYMSLYILKVGDALHVPITEKMVRCATGELVRTFPLRDLLDPTFGTNDVEAQRKAFAIGFACAREDS